MWINKVATVFKASLWKSFESRLANLVMHGSMISLKVISVLNCKLIDCNYFKNQNINNVFNILKEAFLKGCYNLFQEFFLISAICVQTAILFFDTKDLSSYHHRLIWTNPRRTGNLEATYTNGHVNQHPS